MGVNVEPFQSLLRRGGGKRKIIINSPLWKSLEEYDVFLWFYQEKLYKK